MADCWRSRRALEIITEPYAERIGNLLSSDVGNGYIWIADSLGFSTNEISAFSLRDRACPGRAFLKEWMARGDSTINVLLVHLELAGRHDVISVIEELSDPMCILCLSVDSRFKSVTVRQSATLRDVLVQLCGHDEHFTFHVNTEELVYCGETPLPDGWNSHAGQLKGREIKLKTVRRSRRQTLPATVPTNVQRPPLRHAVSDSQTTVALRHGHVGTPGGSDYERLVPSIPESLDGRSMASDAADSGRPNSDNRDLNPQDDLDSFATGLSDQFLNLSLQSSTPIGSMAHDETLLGLSGYHPDATCDEMIGRRLALYLQKDGWYIIRPSRDPNSSNFCISIVYRGDIISYRIHTFQDILNGEIRLRYYLFEGEEEFDSLQELVDYYKDHIMEPNGLTMGPRIRRPVPYKHSQNN